jgi:hypothetical protein
MDTTIIGYLDHLGYLYCPDCAESHGVKCLSIAMRCENLVYDEQCDKCLAFVNETEETAP